MALDLGQLAKKLLVNPIVAAGRAIGRDYKATVYGPDWEERRAARKVNAELTRQKIEAEIRRSNASADADVENSRYAAALRGAQLDAALLQRHGLEAAAKSAGVPVEEYVGKQITEKDKAAAQAAEDMSLVRQALAALNAAKTEHAGDPRPAQPGQFFQIVGADGQPAFFSPRSGATVPAPAGSQPKPSATEVDRRSALSSMLNNATRLHALVDKVPDDSFGPISGRIGAMQSKLVGNSPDVVTLQTMTDDAADMLLRARSGAQINEQEYERLRNLVPDYRTPKSTYKTKLAYFTGQLQQLLNARRQGGMATPVDGAAPAPGAGAQDNDPLGIR